MITMDLQLRKYKFIQELIHVEKVSVIEALERVLKQEKEKQKEEISRTNKKELDHRLESYKNNPDDVLDWETVKNDW